VFVFAACEGTLCCRIVYVSLLFIFVLHYFLCKCFATLCVCVRGMQWNIILQDCVFTTPLCLHFTTFGVRVLLFYNCVVLPLYLCLLLFVFVDCMCLYSIVYYT